MGKYTYAVRSAIVTVSVPITDTLAQRDKGSRLAFRALRTYYPAIRVNERILNFEVHGLPMLFAKHRKRITCDISPPLAMSMDGEPVCFRPSV